MLLPLASIWCSLQWVRSESRLSSGHLAEVSNWPVRSLVMISITASMRKPTQLRTQTFFGCWDEQHLNRVPSRFTKAFPHFNTAFAISPRPWCSVQLTRITFNGVRSWATLWTILNSFLNSKWMIHKYQYLWSIEYCGKKYHNTKPYWYFLPPIK